MAAISPRSASFLGRAVNQSMREGTMARCKASSPSDAGLRGRDIVPAKCATGCRQRPSRPCGPSGAARAGPGFHALPAHRRTSAAPHAAVRRAAPALLAGYGRTAGAPDGPVAQPAAGPTVRPPGRGRPDAPRRALLRHLDMFPDRIPATAPDPPARKSRMDTGFDPDAVIEPVERVARAESRLRLPPAGPGLAEPLNAGQAKCVPPGCGGTPATGSANGPGTQGSPADPLTRLPEVLGAGART